MLDIQNLSKTFNPGTVNEKKALSSLSLHLDEGDFVTIVGYRDCRSAYPPCQNDDNRQWLVKISDCFLS